ncbi:MAG: thiamine pyrophosphate-binding protein [Proteobacteria bacterium]|nr:thiamine pyrophosphate-binding protein [Pseudomonadota bacterium]
MDSHRTIPSDGTLGGAEALVHMLHAHGVKHVFGLCGDTSLPLYDAFARLPHGIAHVLTRDERSAAYMADAYARVSGRVGVCEGPSGGGATYILPGLVEANESSVPVLGITTDISVSARGRYTLTELDQESLFRPLTKWNTVIDRASKLPETVRTAFRQMTTGKPGAAHIGLPLDVQREPVDASDIWAQRELGLCPAWRSAPDPAAVTCAAALLAAAERPLFICGGGVVIAGAEVELAALAQHAGAMVATTISGKGSIAENHPLALGVVGSNGGTPATRELVSRADLVVFVGCRAGSVTTEKWSVPKRGTRIVHVDIDPGVIGVSYPTEVALVGDAKLTLAALNAEFARNHKARPDKLAAAAIAEAKRGKFDAFRSLAESAATPIRPERVVAELQRVLPRDAIIVADPGTPCPYFAAYYQFDDPGRHFISNRAHGALGYSLSAALGAWHGRPQSKVVAVMGDGSFGFTCGELETVVRCKAPITFVVLSNSMYGWIKAGQKTSYGGRYFGVDFQQTQHARVAEAFGVKAWRVEDPAQLRAAIAAAVQYPGPTLLDIVCQPLPESAAPVSEWIV